MGIEHLLGSLSFGMAVHSVGSIYYTFKGDFSPSDIGVLALYGVEFLGALGAGFLGRCANGSQKLKDEGLENVVGVDSAGTHAYHVGESPDPRSQSTASKRGIRIAIP